MSWLVNNASLNCIAHIPLSCSLLSRGSLTERPTWHSLYREARNQKSRTFLTFSRARILQQVTNQKDLLAGRAALENTSDLIAHTFYNDRHSIESSPDQLKLQNTITPNNHHANVVFSLAPPCHAHLLNCLAQNYIHELIVAAQSTCHFSVLIQRQRHLLVKVRPVIGEKE